MSKSPAPTAPRGSHQSHDAWARWLLHVRHGGDAVQQQHILEHLAPIRERVLDNASLAADDTVLDVGSGDGLIGFGLLTRLGPAGRVIFSDISPHLLDYCRNVAEQTGVAGCCRWVQASADDLAPIAAASVDAVTIRSVLIYVADRERAFRECHRVLRPGGRLSIFEPVNRYFGYPAPWPWDVGPVQDLADKVRAVALRIHPPGDPLVNFDERDLLCAAEAAGFRSVRLELQVTVQPPRPRAWATFLHASGNPRLPPWGETLAQTLTPTEAERFAAHLRPLVEQGQGTERSAGAYLRAVKE